MTDYIIGIAVSLLLQGAKKVDSIPVNSGQVAKLRIVGLFLSFAGTVIASYVAGDLANEAMWKTGVDGVVSYLVATGFYSGILKKA